MKVRRILVSSLSMFGAGLISTSAAAAPIAIGNANGNVYVRDTANLNSVEALADGGDFGGGVTDIIGLSNGSLAFSAGNAVFVRDGANLNTNTATSSGTAGFSAGGTITALASDNTTLFIANSSGNIYGRSVTNLNTVTLASGDAADFTGAAVVPVTDLVILADGNLGISTGNPDGRVYVRSSSNLNTNEALNSGANGFNGAGDTINALGSASGGTADTAGTIFIANDDGNVYARSVNNLFTVNAANEGLNFGGGVGITAFSTTADGDLIFGTADGKVYVRSTTNLNTNGALNSGADFNGGGTGAVTAVYGSADGRIFIGMDDGRLYVRDQNNLFTTASTLDGTLGFSNGGNAITAFAEVVPEPSSIALLGIGTMLIAARSRRHAS